MEVLPFSSLLGKMRSLALNISPCPCQGCSGRLWSDLFSMFCQFSVAGDFISCSLTAHRAELLLFVLFTLPMERWWWPPCSSSLQVSIATQFPNLLPYSYILNKNKLQNLESESNSWKVRSQGFRLCWDLLPVTSPVWSLDDLRPVCLLSLFILQLLKWREGVGRWCLGQDRVPPFQYLRWEWCLSKVLSIFIHWDSQCVLLDHPHIHSVLWAVWPPSLPLFPLITLPKCPFNLLFRISQISLLHPLCSFPISSFLQAPTILLLLGEPFGSVHLWCPFTLWSD